MFKIMMLVAVVFMCAFVALWIEAALEDRNHERGLYGKNEDLGL